MFPSNYVVAVLLLDLSLLSVSVGDISINEEGPSDIQMISIESVPMSLIEEIGSRAWSSSYSDVYTGQENGSSYDEVDVDYMNLHFSVGPGSGLDLETIQDEVLRQIGELLGSDQYFATAALIACSKVDLVMYLQLRYTDALDNEHQKRVIKTIYNAVEVEGYLGNLNVFHLYVQNTQGTYVRIDDICDFDGCPDGIKCSSKGQQCIWNCSLNSGYCPKRSECVDKQSNGFYCRCDHDTKSSRCENMTDSNSIPSSSLGSPWTKIIVTVISSIVVCVLVVCITLKVLRIYHRKPTVICRDHHQTVIDFQNNSIESSVNDTVVNQAEFQFLLPMESDRATLIPNGNALPQNGETSTAFLLIDNHEHF